MYYTNLITIKHSITINRQTSCFSQLLAYTCTFIIDKQWIANPWPPSNRTKFSTTKPDC